MSEVFPLARERQSSVPANLPLTIFISLVLPILVLGSAFGQAKVNESLETAPLYVDTLNGQDSNSGTQQKPLKTIGAAASKAETNNQSSIGTKVIINPGTYRESITLSKNNKDTSLPITFQAATNGTVIVSGATVYSGWGTYSLNNSIYTNSWTNNWGECPQLTSCPYQQNIMMRQEMVVVNGTALTQVLSLGQMLQGTFYVDENANQISAHLLSLPAEHHDAAGNGCCERHSLDAGALSRTNVAGHLLRRRKRQPDLSSPPVPTSRTS